MSSRIADMLPDGIHPWLPLELDREKAPEKYTTCDDCAMLVEGEDPDAGAVVFRPESKCCTYHPWLPNFQVGGLLRDPEPGLEQGRERVRAKIAAREGVTPTGIHVPKVREHLYEIGRERIFGLSQALRCPYYREDVGGCGVWKYREAVCSTWFCKYAEGEDGDTFWRAVRDYLVELEEALTLHALLELGFDGASLQRWLKGKERMGPRDYDGEGPGDEEYARIWGRWLGREEELYVKTREIVETITPEAAKELAGVRGRTRLDAVTRAADVLDAGEVPDPVHLSKRLSYATDDTGAAVLTSYSSYDPTRIPQQLFQALGRFDGKRSNAEALQSIESEHGVRLSPGLVLTLYRQRILVADDG